MDFSKAIASPRIRGLIRGREQLPETTVNTPNVPFEMQTEMTTTGSGQTLDDLHCSNTFEISDGVRRAKAAEQLGLKSIEAMDYIGKTFQVKIDNLRSPFKIL